MTKIDKILLILWVLLALFAGGMAMLAAMTHQYASAAIDIGVFVYAIINYFYDRAYYKRETMKGHYDFYN